MSAELGVCYYPEHWPEARWCEDAQQMWQAGIRWVRIGEFAWGRLEPEPDGFRWGWLDRAIETLGRAGLKIVLGTPTATPPRWMLDKHPDMLAVDDTGQPRGFGSRRHYDFSHPGFREESRRICRLMAERYGQNPYIAFWQTDNEYGCHDTALSYSTAALRGFQRWLADKYSNIERLNQAWGNVFWSMEYPDFQAIALPHLTVTEANPAHWQDFRRYTSEQVVQFNRLQVAAIREFDTQTPILHNYMGLVTDFDHFAVGGDLDAAGWDSYPLGFLEDRVVARADWKQRFMRQGDPDFQAFHHDLYRAVGKGRWWVVEQQPGPVNWAPYNPVPLAGMVRLWGWEAVAHGAEVVSYFRWRQAPFAQEQMHAGLLRPDGEPAPGLAEVRQLARELMQYGEQKVQPAPVALVFDYESAWAWEIQPQGRDFSYFRLLFEQYRGLRQLGLSVDICSPEQQDFSAYQLVLVPGLMYWRPALQQALKDSGAVVLIGPRTGSKNADFAIPEGLPPNCPQLIDVRVAQAESIRPDVSIALEGGGHIGHWREVLETGPDTQTLLSTMQQEPVLVEQGNTYYLAAWLDSEGCRRVMQILSKRAGLQTLELPGGVRLRQWGTRQVLINYEAHAVELDTLAETLGLTENVLPAAAVRVI